MTKTKKLFLIVGALLLAICGIVLYFSLKPISSPTNKANVLLTMAEEGKNFFPLNLAKEVEFDFDNETFSLELTELKFDAMQMVNKANAYANMQNYTPYKDIFIKPWESFIFANCRNIKSDITIKITLNNNNNAKINIFINDACIGEINIILNAVNFDEKTINNIFNSLKNNIFIEIKSKILIDSVTITYIPYDFMKNYNKYLQMSPYGNLIQKKNFLNSYETYVKSLNVNNEKILFNRESLAAFINNPMILKVKLDLTQSLTLGEALTFIPAGLIKTK